jgi:hypothetical protein
MTSHAVGQSRTRGGGSKGFGPFHSLLSFIQTKSSGVQSYQDRWKRVRSQQPTAILEHYWLHASSVPEDDGSQMRDLGDVG